MKSPNYEVFDDSDLNSEYSASISNVSSGKKESGHPRTLSKHFELREDFWEKALS